MYQYKVIDHRSLYKKFPGYIDIEGLQEELNTIAADGWELVNVNCAVGGIFSVWRRKI